MKTRKETITAPFAAEKEYMEYRIAEGIENNRKDRAVIHIQDKQGKPLTHAKVKITQASHQFKFGANLFLLDEMESEEKNKKYRDLFHQVFNHATLPIYWSDLEPEQGKPRFEKSSPRIYRRPPPDLCLEYCREHNIKAKAHCLVYDVWTPKWVPEDVLGSKKAYRERIRRLAERYQDQIEDWEVINETLIPFQSRNHALFKEPDYLEWSFDLAKQFLPDNRLLLNEATQWIWGKEFNYNRGQYYLLIERLLKMGTRIDGIGMQFHMFYPQAEEEAVTPAYYDPRRIYALMDCYGQFNKPVEITEITIPAYSEKTEDEETQAEITKNLYRMWFSHKTVESIVWWNLVDGYAHVHDSGWNENMYYGGLLRHDMSPKPAWNIVRDLITREWQTRAELFSGDTDQVSFRGFYGSYDVEISVGGEKVNRTICLNNRNGIRDFTITI
ncbi:beta-xylanase [Spirochaetia bacterium]|nr:beta-xylanase [Spirochaetia bacterium]